MNGIAFLLCWFCISSFRDVCQVTYDSQSGSIGMDNADIRYANHAAISEYDLTYGFTFNNNPIVQDLWNATPVWGYPFSPRGSALSPGCFIRDDRPWCCTLLEIIVLKVGQVIMTDQEEIRTIITAFTFSPGLIFKKFQFPR